MTFCDCAVVRRPGEGRTGYKQAAERVLPGVAVLLDELDPSPPLCAHAILRLGGKWRVPLSRAAELLGRFQKLKDEKEKFENRQGLIFRDRDLDQAIQIVDRENESVRRNLADFALSRTRKH